MWYVVVVVALKVARGTEWLENAPSAPTCRNCWSFFLEGKYLGGGKREGSGRIMCGRQAGRQAEGGV